MCFHAPKTLSPSKRKAIPIKYFVVFTHNLPAFLFLPQDVAEAHQFQQSRSSRAGSEKVKAIEHPSYFQNKTQYSAHVAYHNVIYVPNHHFYKGNGRKVKAWHLIAVVLGVEVEYIRFRNYRVIS